MRKTLIFQPLKAHGFESLDYRIQMSLDCISNCGGDFKYVSFSLQESQGQQNFGHNKPSVSIVLANEGPIT